MDQPGDEQNDTKRAPLRLNAETLKALTRRTVEDGTSVQKIIEARVEDDLDRTGK